MGVVLIPMMESSLLLLLLLPLAAPLDVYSPSQQEFEALVTLSKAGILELNTLELEDNVDVSAVSPDDLARLLASCKDGFELSGVALNRGQWKALVERSRGHDWAPKYISLEYFDDLNKTLGVMGENHGRGDQWDLQELISNTEMVYISDLPLDNLGDWPNSSKAKDKCRWLEIWYNGEKAIGNMALEKFGMPMKEGWRLARQEFDDEEEYGVFRLVV